MMDRPATCVLVAAGLCLLCGFLSPARADVVAAAGRPMTVGVQVLEVSQGRLRYQLPGGREVSRPVEQIKYLQITGFDDFNEIEKQFRDGRLASAASGYERLLSDLQDSPSSPPCSV